MPFEFSRWQSSEGCGVSFSIVREEALSGVLSVEDLGLLGSGAIRQSSALPFAFFEPCFAGAFLEVLGDVFLGLARVAGFLGDGVCLGRYVWFLGGFFKRLSGASLTRCHLVRFVGAVPDQGGGQGSSGDPLTLEIGN